MPDPSQALRRFQEEESRQRVAELLRRVNDQAHAAFRHREKRTRTQEDLAGLEARNPEFANAETSSTTADFVIVLGVLAVLSLDFWLFGSLAEFLVSLGFGNDPRLVWVARILIPVSVVFLELKLSNLMHMERRGRDGLGVSGRYYIFLALGILIMLVMPLISVATTVAARAGTAADARRAFDAMTLGLVLLALVSHAALLFGGPSAHRAKARLVFSARRRTFRRNIELADARFRREAPRLVTVTTAYIHSLQDHNTSFPGRHLDAGPFDRVTRETVNEVFGYEMIAAPAVNRGNGNHGGNETAPTNLSFTPTPAINAENDVRTPQADNHDDEPQPFSRGGEDEVRI